MACFVGQAPVCNERRRKKRAGSCGSDDFKKTDTITESKGRGRNALIYATPLAVRGICATGPGPSCDRPIGKWAVAGGGAGGEVGSWSLLPLPTVIADHSSVPHGKAWGFNGEISGPLDGAALAPTKFGRRRRPGPSARRLRNPWSAKLPRVVLAEPRRVSEYRGPKFTLRTAGGGESDLKV